MMQSQQIPMTFQRYETKYMLSPIMARKLRKSLPGHLQMDEYGLDTICSLYYDTPDHQLIRRSLEKPVYKEKLRLRSYGPAKETSPIYVELKKKYEGIVYKRRERMILSEAVPYLAGKSEPGFDSQILHEITWFRNYYRGACSRYVHRLRPHRLLLHGRQELSCYLRHQYPMAYRQSVS